ncbi:hypothetical protein Z043_100732 [Scleropages formosus]|uniref:CTNNB1 binding N-teminal domain-containing protein n=1 Tax=Scleropages formosus TaxID=113540 RepID=A0A0P7XW95_SCLFO|nr:hypothetical protein Z043_100732 [Scleropages formosus]
MPQLNGGGGDDLGANDEMISFKDEGEQDEKIQESAFTERDLADLKSSLVNESEISQNPGAVTGPGAVRRGQQDDQRVYSDKHRDHLDDGKARSRVQNWREERCRDGCHRDSALPPLPREHEHESARALARWHPPRGRLCNENRFVFKTVQRWTEGHLSSWFIFLLVSKHQDGGAYKAPAYSGYPFLMLPDPYLPNGSMSPSSNYKGNGLLSKE